MDGDQVVRQAVSKLFDDTRKRLVETGTRNRLIHVNLSNSRGNFLNVVNERADDVHALLSGGKTMRFLPIGQDSGEVRGEPILVDAGQRGFDESRYTDAQLEVRLGPDALQKRLLKIAREAQTAEEDSGVNVLYLAMGFLTWYEDKTSRLPRSAPLVLLPVELRRNAKTSTYDVRAREEEVLTNLPLQQRLLDDFGIELPELEVVEGWRPADYFAQVEEVVTAREGWKIQADAIQLGFFSFSKQLMYLDLDMTAWPDDALAEHVLTRGLLYERFEENEPLFSADDRLDEILPPDKLFHVVDADASQAKVIEEVRSGRNLVVQGPPGTGKSQTITNIIAAAVQEGKRVLFVAEKMAALSVVYDRLVKVGLRDICLELHSRTANKKYVLGELARTLMQAGAVPDMPPPPVALTESRDRLNALAAALHQPIGDTGETAYSVLGHQSLFIGNDAPPPSLGAECLSSMSRENEASLSATIRDYGVALAEGGLGNPFEGARNLALQPVDLKRLALSLSDAQAKTADLASTMRETFELLLGQSGHAALNATGQLVDVLERLEGSHEDDADIMQAILSASDIARLKEALQAGAEWRASHEGATPIFVDSAFAASVTHLRAALAAGAQSFLARWGGRYRGASRELAGLLKDVLPKTARERVDLIDMLSKVASLKADWENDREYCGRVLGDAWRGEKSDFGRLGAIATWCTRVSASPIKLAPNKVVGIVSQAEKIATLLRGLREGEPAARSAMSEVIRTLDLDPATLGEGGPDSVPLDDVAARFGSMASSIEHSYIAWVGRSRLQQTLVSAGLSELEARMRHGNLNGAAAVVELRYARAEVLWKRALAQNPALQGLDQERRHDLVATFAKLERERLKDNVTNILASHLTQVPKGAMGEMGVIRGEIAKKRGHLALRKLFAKSGVAIQRIKPVLLMSPISVAQFLPPGTVSFDLLVIDEASQVRPEDALGAIARAGQIVVVGDKKQLPPSSFFDRVLADEEDSSEDEENGVPDVLEGAAKVADMESILTLCEARGLSSRMLQWHYRSRDPSLISVSNHEFYEGGLVLPPSPLQKDPAYGLCFTRVDGIYDKGGKRDNRREADAIVDRVAQHARSTPSQSLGVVTFSFAQRNLITLLMDERRRHDATLDAFLREGQAEDLFVKNIENVQGDERDVILVSVGYGPTVPGGRPSMSFGPVNGEGGERRLNVLFTRARIRCEVFASFDPGDLDLSRTKAEGPRILKRFLEFAKNGVVDDSAPTGEEADSPFEEDVAAAIRAYGFLADPQVGSSGFRIDMGVRHPDRPGTYILAVECDGATYHSALWARERDRLRQDVLEHLGWRFHRIWSTDWFYNRRVEIERLRVALVEAHESAQQGVRIDGANKARPVSADPDETRLEPIEVPEVAERKMPPYERAVFPVRSSYEPHEAPNSVLAELAQKIVAVEGPIHQDEVARRIAACFGKEKAGSRILDATKFALLRARTENPDLMTDGTFWYTGSQIEAPPIRDRSAEGGATLKAENISLLEIRAAFKIAHEDNAGGNDSDLIRVVARMLGFKRVGPDLQVRIAEGLQRL